MPIVLFHGYGGMDEEESSKLHLIDDDDDDHKSPLPVIHKSDIPYSLGRSTCSLGNVIYFLGGGGYVETGRGGVRIAGKKDVMAFDTETMTESPLPDMIVPRYEPKVVFCSGLMYVLGGARSFLPDHGRTCNDYPQVDLSLFSLPHDPWGECFDFDSWSWKEIDVPPVGDECISQPHVYLQLTSCSVQPDQTKILCCCDTCEDTILVYNVQRRQWDTSIKISTICMTRSLCYSSDEFPYLCPTGLLASSSADMVLLFYWLEHLYVYDLHQVVPVGGYHLPDEIPCTTVYACQTGDDDSFCLIWSAHGEYAPLRRFTFKVTKTRKGYRFKPSKRVHRFVLENIDRNYRFTNCQIFSSQGDSYQSVVI